VVPPHKNAVCSDAGDTQRDQHIQTIAEQGRIAWQRKTGYNLRSYVELAMQRYKWGALSTFLFIQQRPGPWIFRKIIF
jgi:hypothetical protein